MKQYLRKWSMMINGEPFIDGSDERQFRCVFDILVNPQNTLARADIQIYNLSKSTTIEQRADISFSAGYQDNFDTIFIGTVTNVFKERRGPDVVTRLLCSSLRRGTMASPYGAGIPLTDVLKDIAKKWPLYLEMDESQFDDKDVFPSGYTISGDIPYALESLAYAFGFKWMQDRGALIITREDKERSTDVFEINQFTGMVGMPEVSRGVQGIGVNVTTRLNPFIRATSRINIKSEFSTYNTGNTFIAEMAGDASANGEYNVFTMQYVGDTHGEAWDLRIDGIRAGTKALVATISGGSLVWGAAVSPEFRAKVREIGDRQSLDPNWYMAVMAFETGGAFKAYTKNPYSGATGLIQFMPSTANGMGTSTAALANMTEVEQLDWVEKYFQPYVGRIRNLADMYMAVLWPKGVGKSDDWVLWTSGSIQYTQNAGLDTNHDGTITRGEAAGRVFDAFKEGQGRMA
ncbi:baseplate hub protein [Allopusillimonas ginsengisoli]|uniref:baseplate hub protein n=1 Tax=Allopusillimonas ginsengisoli TaxID=453575 RepID=UPI0039C3EC1C